MVCASRPIHPIDGYDINEISNALKQIAVSKYKNVTPKNSSLVPKKHGTESKVEDVFRNIAISIGSFYYWRNKYVKLRVREAQHHIKFEAENNKIKNRWAIKCLKLTL